jgi:TPP-dependent pyruvate/acetoin dehydrogenase alpha subunit
VYDKVMAAVAHARSGKGPSIVECKTYRAYGHGDHDDDRAARYRPEKEVLEGRSRDPIAVCRAKLKEKGLLPAEWDGKFLCEHKNAGEATNEDFLPEVVEYLNEGIEFALASPLPDAEEAARWVFKEDA